MARYWFDRCARAGLWIGHHNLGVILCEGLATNRDASAAFLHLKEAARSLEPVSLRRYAECYRQASGAYRTRRSRMCWTRWPHLSASTMRKRKKIKASKQFFPSYPAYEPLSLSDFLCGFQLNSSCIPMAIAAPCPTTLPAAPAMALAVKSKAKPEAVAPKRLVASPPANCVAK
jgi:TPR repeat protein